MPDVCVAWQWLQPDKPNKLLNWVWASYDCPASSSTKEFSSTPGGDWFKVPPLHAPKCPKLDDPTIRCIMDLLLPLVLLPWRTPSCSKTVFVDDKLLLVEKSNNWCQSGRLFLLTAPFQVPLALRENNGLPRWIFSITPCWDSKKAGCCV